MFSFTNHFNNFRAVLANRYAQYAAAGFAAWFALRNRIRDATHYVTDRVNDLVFGYFVRRVRNQPLLLNVQRTIGEVRNLWNNITISPTTKLGDLWSRTRYCVASDAPANCFVPHGNGGIVKVQGSSESGYTSFLYQPGAFLAAQQVVTCRNTSYVNPTIFDCTAREFGGETRSFEWFLEQAAYNMPLHSTFLAYQNVSGNNALVPCVVVGADTYKGYVARANSTLCSVGINLSYIDEVRFTAALLNFIVVAEIKVTRNTTIGEILLDLLNTLETQCTAMDEMEDALTTMKRQELIIPLLLSLKNVFSPRLSNAILGAFGLYVTRVPFRTPVIVRVIDTLIASGIIVRYENGSYSLADFAEGRFEARLLAALWFLMERRLCGPSPISFESHSLDKTIFERAVREGIIDHEVYAKFLRYAQTEGDHVLKNAVGVVHDALKHSNTSAGVLQPVMLSYQNLVDPKSTKIAGFTLSSYSAKEREKIIKEYQNSLENLMSFAEYNGVISSPQNRPLVEQKLAGIDLNNEQLKFALTTPAMRDRLVPLLNKASWNPHDIEVVGSIVAVMKSKPLKEFVKARSEGKTLAASDTANEYIANLPDSGQRGALGSAASVPSSNIRPGQTMDSTVANLLNWQLRKNAGTSHTRDKMDRYATGKGGSAAAFGGPSTDIRGKRFLYDDKDDQNDDDEGDLAGADITDFGASPDDDDLTLVPHCGTIHTRNFHSTLVKRGIFNPLDMELYTHSLQKFVTAPTTTPDVLRVSWRKDESSLPNVAIATAVSVPVMIYDATGNRSISTRKYLAVPLDLLDDPSGKTFPAESIKAALTAGKVTFTKFTNGDKEAWTKEINYSSYLDDVLYSVKYFINKKIGIVLLPSVHMTLEYVRAGFVNGTDVGAAVYVPGCSKPYIVSYNVIEDTISHNFNTEPGKCGAPFMVENRLSCINVGLAQAHSHACGIAFPIVNKWQHLRVLASPHCVKSYYMSPEEVEKANSCGGTFENHSLKPSAAAASTSVAQNDDDDTTCSNNGTEPSTDSVAASPKEEKKEEAQDAYLTRLWNFLHGYSVVKAHDEAVRAKSSNTRLFDSHLRRLHSFPYEDVMHMGNPSDVVFQDFTLVTADKAMITPTIEALVAEESLAVDKVDVSPEIIERMHRTLQSKIKSCYDNTSKYENISLFKRLSQVDLVHHKVVYLSAMIYLAKTTAAGFLYSSFGLPPPVAGGDKYDWVSQVTGNMAVLDKVMDQISNIQADLRSNHANTEFPVSMYGKLEPMSLTKLTTGRFRTIKDPYFLISVVQFVNSSLIGVSDKMPLFSNFAAACRDHNWALGPPPLPVRFASLDYIMSLFGLPVTGDPKVLHEGKCFGSLVGTDLFTALKALANNPKFLNETTRTVSLDVSGWDKSLPLPFVRSLFEFVCNNKNFGVNLANGMNRDAIYHFMGKAMKIPTTSWCSGNLATLSGNSIIHDAMLTRLYRILPANPGSLWWVVQGDDAVVACNDKDISDDDLVKAVNTVYSDAGMKLKQSTLATGEFDFCSVVVKHKIGPQVDVARLVRKFMVKGIILPTALSALLRNVSIANETYEVIAHEFGQGVAHSIRRLKELGPQTSKAVFFSPSSTKMEPIAALLDPSSMAFSEPTAKSKSVPFNVRLTLKTIGVTREGELA